MFNDFDYRDTFSFQENDLNNKLIREDKSTILKRVRKCGGNLEFASDNLKNDDDIVNAAIEKSGLAIQHASPRLQDNEDIALKAIKNNYVAYKFVSDRLRANQYFVSKALKVNSELGRVIPIEQLPGQITHSDVSQANPECVNIQSDITVDRDFPFLNNNPINTISSLFNSKRVHYSRKYDVNSHSPYYSMVYPQHNHGMQYTHTHVNDIHKFRTLNELAKKRRLYELNIFIKYQNW